MTSGSSIMHTVQTKPRRGRKQDDSLPPSRARDVQRAFRARRAAHLANLESRNTWLEQENLELRRRLGMGEDDPPVSGPEPEMQVVGSPGGSSKGEETLVKNEDGSPPPAFGWDEQGKGKGKAAEHDQAYQQQPVNSWNARRLDPAATNALGFDPSQGGWDGRPNGVTQPSLPLPPQHGLQLLPPLHNNPYENNPLSFLASLPMAGFGPPPPHSHPAHSVPNGSSNYEPYPYPWPPAQRHQQHAPIAGHAASSPTAVYPHSF
ncbi:hypothetical protein JCM10212_001096 [Sporobolomyces blumeae]